MRNNKPFVFYVKFSKMEEEGKRANCFNLLEHLFSMSDEEDEQDEQDEQEAMVCDDTMYMYTFVEIYIYMREHVCTFCHVIASAKRTPNSKDKFTHTHTCISQYRICHR